MGIDAEKAFCMAHYHNNQFRMECMDVFARGPANWQERIETLREWAEKHHLLVEDHGVFSRVVLYPASTTRKRPACIVIVPSQGQFIEGAYLLDHTGVCDIQYVEKGRVRVGKPSETTEVRGTQESSSLCA